MTQDRTVTATFTVQPPATQNTPPTVNAGADLTVTLPNSAPLSGSATDDGLPNPPGAVTFAWSQVSGPGTVMFANPNAAATTATFSAAGPYVLRLTANDGSLSASDDVAITVVTPVDVGIPHDLNGDGKADLIWHHATTGDVAVWLMNGPAVLAASLITQVRDLGWQIVGVGDLNGDGKADLIWHHATTGDVAVWLMNGPAVLAASLITQVSDLGWQIQ
jgi:hypothetical protein